LKTAKKKKEKIALVRRDRVHLKKEKNKEIDQISEERERKERTQNME